MSAELVEWGLETQQRLLFMLLFSYSMLVWNKNWSYSTKEFRKLQWYCFILWKELASIVWPILFDYPIIWFYHDNCQFTPKAFKIRKLSNGKEYIYIYIYIYYIILYNLVPLFKMIIIINFFRDWLFSQSMNTKIFA